MPTVSTAGQGGATLIELLMGMAIVAFMLGIGVPSMTNWIATNKAGTASEFYAEGFSLARREAVKHNAASRIVLTSNAGNGQMDWQVDICFPAPGTPCTDNTGVWSSTALAAANDPEGAAGFRSVLRTAAALPKAEMLAPSVEPAGASKVYFTSLGWVDTNYDERLTRIRFDPAARFQDQIRPVALAVTLAGIAVKCHPEIAAPDSRACPP